MKIVFRSLLSLAVLSVACLAYADDSDAPTSKGDKPLLKPDWAVKPSKALKTIIEGNKRVDIFRAEVERSEKIDCAWASCVLLDNTCMVIIWIRGTREDTRIIYEGKKEYNLCTVYIPSKDFDKHFKYCVLSGIKSETEKGFLASFGGGPFGDRTDYWFEWGDPSYVIPDFYCILK